MTASSSSSRGLNGQWFWTRTRLGESREFSIQGLQRELAHRTSSQRSPAKIDQVDGWILPTTDNACGEQRGRSVWCSVCGRARQDIKSAEKMCSTNLCYHDLDTYIGYQWLISDEPKKLMRWEMPGRLKIKSSQNYLAPVVPWHPRRANKTSVSLCLTQGANTEYHLHQVYRFSKSCEFQRTLHLINDHWHSHSAHPRFNVRKETLLDKEYRLRLQTLVPSTWWSTFGFIVWQQPVNQTGVVSKQNARTNARTSIFVRIRSSR